MITDGQAIRIAAEWQDPGHGITLATLASTGRTPDRGWLAMHARDLAAGVEAHPDHYDDPAESVRELLALAEWVEARADDAPRATGWDDAPVSA